MGSRRGKAYQGLLVGVLLAPAAALEAGELTGTWQGAFSCGGTQFTWQLAIDEHRLCDEFHIRESSISIAVCQHSCRVFLRSGL
jgi:hypothetical protein